MAKIKVNFIHLCDAATIDGSGKLNMLGIFSKINMVSLPGKFPKFTLVVNLGLEELTNKKYSIKMVILDPDKQELKLTQPVEIGFEYSKKNEEKGESEMNVVLEMVNIEFTKYGKHSLVVRFDDEPVGSVGFNVEQIKQK